MGTVNINLREDTQLNLILGQQLENEVTEVVFDFSAWQSAYGSGIVGLSVQRHGDDRPYAVDPTVSGTEATWNISDLDTARKGVGEVQVTYTVGTVIKKSVVYKFTVYRSLGENGEYPSPGQTWQEEIEAELTDVKADLDALKNKGAGLTEEAKQALLACFQQVAWIGDDGQDYYDALEAALYPPSNLVSISASFNSGGTTIYNINTLDDLKQYLAVTALYDDLTTETIYDYILTGSMAEGTQTITVTYGGKTTTFSVTVENWVTSITAVYTQSGTVLQIDSLDSLKSDLVVSAVYADTTSEVINDYTLYGTLESGTSTITASYMGKTATFSVTVTAWDYYNYSLGNRQIIKLGAGTSGYSVSHKNYGNIGFYFQDSNRRSFPTKLVGVKPMDSYDAQDNFIESTDYYPIPIPSAAVKAVVSITPNTQFTGSSFYTYADGKYTRQADPGWKQGSFTYEFTAGQYEYMTIASKYNSAGSSYPTEPTEVTLTFLTE